MTINSKIAMLRIHATPYTASTGRLLVQFHKLQEIEDATDMSADEFVGALGYE